MEKVKMKICTGTMCHVMGGAELPEMAKELQVQYGGKLDIRGSSCMGYCKDNDTKPPYVEIDGVTLTGVTKDCIVKYLDALFDHDRKE